MAELDDVTFVRLLGDFNGGAPGARQALLSWLFLYGRELVRREVSIQERDDLASKLIEWWIDHLDDWASQCTGSNPYSMLLRTCWWRIQDFQREITTRIRADHDTTMELRRLFPGIYCREPWARAALMEYREHAVGEIEESVRTFRFPRWRRVYAFIANHWLKDGTELSPHPLPQGIVQAMIYHLRKTVSHGASRIHAATR